MKTFFMVLITFFFLFQAGNLCVADQIETKDGALIKGKIIEHTIGKGYKIKTQDGSIFYIEESKIVNIKFGQEAEVKYRSPALSWFLSFLVPGVGQFYNGDIGAGVTMLLIGIASTSASLGISAGNWIISQIHAPIRSSSINKKSLESSLLDETYFVQYRKKTFQLSLNPLIKEDDAGILISFDYNF